jgi:hypothetical protein
VASQGAITLAIAAHKQSHTLSAPDEPCGFRRAGVFRISRMRIARTFVSVGPRGELEFGKELGTTCACLAWGGPICPRELPVRVRNDFVGLYARAFD